MSDSKRFVGDGGKPYCCWPECKKDAAFDIYGESNHPDDNTQACEDHVGALLGTSVGIPTNHHWTVSEIVRSPDVSPPDAEVAEVGKVT